MNFDKNPYYRNSAESLFENYNTFFNEKITNVQDDNKNNKESVFKLTYPLFVLIESLINTDFYIDEKMIAILKQALKDDNKEFVFKNIHKITRNLNIDNEENKLFKAWLKENMYMPYLSELYSDAIVLLDNIYMLNKRGIYISLRTMLEDLYRHIYYKDHKEELFQTQSDSSSYQSIKFFREYLEKASFLKILKENKNSKEEENKEIDFFSLSEDLYKRTSHYVHASNKNYMNMFYKNSNRIEFEKNKKIETYEFYIDIRNTIKIIIAFLICTHQYEFLNLNEYTKSLVFEAFNKDEKIFFRKKVGV